MLHVLIIEDEPLAARRLERLLHKIDPNIQIVAILDTVVDTVDWLSNHEADLIFMDIHLADGNSFSIFEQIKIKTPVIFATAYDQYAIRAFKHNSIDYLLKPIEKEELAQSIKKFTETKSFVPQNFNALLDVLNQRETYYQKRFIVTAGDKIKSIKIEDIAYFYGQKKYVFLISHDNRRHIVDYTLGKLEELVDPEQFFRINRQFIINFDAIKQMYPYSKSRIKVELLPEADTEAIVSIDRSKTFKEWLNR